MRPKNPCYNCDERHNSCHSKCEKYKEFKNGLDAYNNKISNVKKSNQPIDDFLFTRKRRYEYKH